VRSKFPDLSAAEVVHRLTATATDKGAPGRDPEYGYGVLNLVAALTADVPPLSPTAGPPTTRSAAEPTGDATALPKAGLAGHYGTLFGFLGVAALLLLAAIVGAFIVRRRRTAAQPSAAPPGPPGSG
jgi:hypothetical protein